MQTPLDGDISANWIYALPDLSYPLYPDMGSEGAEAGGAHAPFLPEQNINNEFQDLSQPLNAEFVNFCSLAEPSGSTIQSHALSISQSQNLTNFFIAQPTNFHSTCELSQVADQDTAPLANATNSAAVSTPKARYQCNWPACDRSFGRTADRARHLRTLHGNGGTYYCREAGCNKSAEYGKGYSRIDKLQEHMRKKHPGVSFRGTM